MRPGSITSARAAAARAIAAVAADRFDAHPIAIETADLSPRDAALALAIQRVTLQRWLTLEFLLKRFLNQPAAKLEPAMRGVLLTGAAQLLFFDRLPPHAVVDESVKLARSMMRPAAGGLANAVLRRVAELVERRTTELWSPAPNRLPLDDGSLALREPCLPAVEPIAQYLSVATSHPSKLVASWIAELGVEQAVEACLHGIHAPPIFVHQPETPRPVLWSESHERLRAFLAEDVRRRVQDPTAAAAVNATADMAPATVIDYCAGRGTKTRQLLAVHPHAQIVAGDIAPERMTDLQREFARVSRVTVASPDRMPRGADLLVLDVPCGNTGVLGRRPEARYRFSAANVRSLVALQRRIMAQSLPLLKPGGHILYTTCSTTRAENQEQAAFLSDRLGAKVVRESLTLPGGQGENYHDGGYYALLRLTE